jgi:hypothetical protein
MPRCRWVPAARQQILVQAVQARSLEAESLLRLA